MFKRNQVEQALMAELQDMLRAAEAMERANQIILDSNKEYTGVERRKVNKG